MEIRYSTGQHARDARPKPAVCESFDAFERLWLSNRRTLNVLPTDTKEQLSAKKDRLHYFWVDMLDPAVGRKKVNAGSSYMLRFDMDGATAESWETLRELFGVYRGFAYSTASHEHPTANGEQRWRIVLAVSRPVSPSELERISPVVQQDVMDTYDLISDEPVEWDPRVYNAAWLLFGPDERAKTISFNGAVVDVDEVLSRAAPSDSSVIRFRDPTQTNPTGTDDVADYLIANGYVTDDLIDGIKLPITCPFEDGHSSSKGEGDTSTVYLLEKTSGFDRGKFVCLHNSCKHRSQEDFLDKIGYRVADFEDLTADESGGNEPAEYLPWPKFSRDKNDQIEGTITNVLLALRRPDLCGAQIRLDEFRDETILTTTQGKNLLLRDEYYTMLHSKLEGLGFKKFEEAAVKRAVRLIAYENRFDSLKDWIANLPAWDGVPRIDTFFCRHWGIEANAYTHAVGRYWWTLLAGRALVPGIKGDMAVILISQQGKNKSEGIRAMAPTPEHYMELDFGKRGEERVREMRGHNVIELGEMRGMDKRGIGDVRVTISTRADRNRGLFREHYVTLPRRCGFIGTSNSDTPLTDTEGNRRWLPMTIPDETDGKFIAQGIADEKIQLWAEAVVVFKRDGIAWENAETLAKSILGDYEVKDEVWMSCVAEWLEQPQDQYDMTADSTKKNYERVPLTSKDILIDAIGFKATQVKRGDEMKIAATMKKLGYKKIRMQSLSGAPYHWVKR